MSGLKDKIQTAWENRHQIAEGLYNTYINNTSEIYNIAEERINICRSNRCGLYDKDGSSEKAVLKGTECCAGCGCSLNIKKNCMSCQCYLGDINKETGQPHGMPLWTAVMTPEQEQEIADIAFRKQEEKNRNI